MFADGNDVLGFSLISLIDRRGLVEADVPQLAPPTNGITIYGSTQSQQSHTVRLSTDAATAPLPPPSPLKMQLYASLCQKWHRTVFHLFSW